MALLLKNAEKIPAGGVKCYDEHSKLTQSSRICNGLIRFRSHVTDMTKASGIGRLVVWAGELRGDRLTVWRPIRRKDEWEEGKHRWSHAVKSY